MGVNRGFTVGKEKGIRDDVVVLRRGYRPIKEQNRHEDSNPIMKERGYNVCSVGYESI
jgi:hypothetical protein